MFIARLTLNKYGTVKTFNTRTHGKAFVVSGKNINNELKKQLLCLITPIFECE